MTSITNSICRRSLLAALCGAAMAMPLAASAQSQSFPTKPMRLVVAFGTGSVNDLTARDLAQSMGETLGQSVIVENRTGGGGSVGTDFVAKSAADGYTIGLGTSSQLVMNVGVFKSLPFDIEKDIRVIGLIARTPAVLVASTKMPSSLKEVIRYAKANPGKVTYASAGTGSINHIFGESFARATGTSMVHVPYKGSGAALIDVSGGHVDLMLDSLISAAPVAQQGRIHLLGVSSKTRNPAAPNLPTLVEQGLPDMEAVTWNALFVPAQTPQDVVDKLNAALNQAMTDKGVLARLAKGASESLAPSTPTQADAYARSQRERWVPFIRAMQIDSN